MKKKYSLLLIAFLCFVGMGFGQIAAWDFFGESSLATSTADIYSVNLDASNILTRGSTAGASAASNSFRTTGFQNNGISIANTDYFQFTLSAGSGYILSLYTLNARLTGTSSFAVSPGVNSQFAYSLDGINFTLIGTPINSIGTDQTISQDLTGLSALQNLSETVTVTFRYYATGQTTTGGWGFYSNALGNYGLSIDGSLVPISSDTPDWCNLQAPVIGSTNQCAEYLVYARVYEDGVTSVAGFDPNIEAWIGYNSSNIDPSDPSWTWFPANNNVQVGNDDEYILDLGEQLTSAGTYYYTSRFSYNSGPFVYGGYSAGGGNFWDGTTYVNGQVTVANEQVNFCNVDYPKSATINQADSFNVYAQVYEPGITDAVGQGANILAWIGYNTIGINHQPWDPTGWTWVAATYDSDWGNNDQYTAEIGSGLAGGTYYFASRFQINCNEYSYGGIQSNNIGNFWDATYNSGSLTVISNTCASESFVNSGNSGSYGTETWTGDDGIDWTATDSRTDTDLNGSEAVILRTGSLTNNSPYSNGCGTISFDYARIFSGSSTLKVFVNGVQYGGDITVSSLTSSTFSTTVNVTGNVSVELRNSGNRTIINNLSWTCNSCAIPVDASNFIATSGCGGINLLWDYGCAQEVMIVASQGGAVTAIPTGDGSAYIPNTFFGSGTALVAGEFDVYEGTGTSTTITGLTSGLQYNFTIFSRSGTNWTAGVSYNNVIYNESANDVGTFTTYNRCGDIELTWIRPACYDEFLVIARDGSAVTATPTGDGTAYTSNTTFGSGTALAAGEFAVYQGSGNTATITGLTNGNTYHFEIFTRVGSTWSNGVVASGTSDIGTGPNPTTFKPGDLVFIGFDSYINGANDKYSILNMVNIGVDTEFIMANLLYEWNDAAGVSSGKWYDCDVSFDVDPPYAKIQYTGCSNIPKGSTICVETNGAGSIVYITVNGIDATSDFTIDGANYTAGNISTSNPDAMWLMQGTFSNVLTETDGTDNGINPDRYRTFNGTVFGGLQTKGYFQQLTSDGNAGGLRVSRVHPDVECLYLETGPTSDDKFFGFYYGNTVGSQYELLSRITDIPNYWDIQSGTGASQQYDEVNFTCNTIFNITSSASNEGQWIGGVSTDWFDCQNWQNFTVPDASVDVVINSTSTNNCDISATSPYAPKYSYIANCDDIAISSRRLIIDSNGDVLNVYNNLVISGTGILDMNDGNSGTSDGLINLYGSWTNNVGETSFDEGNGTVVFSGTGIQRVNYGGPPTPPAFETEQFYDVILNNNFDTYESNDLYAHGDLTINASKILNVKGGDYAFVNNKVTNNGTFYIEDSGSLVQLGNGTNTNVGDIIMDRTTAMRSLDYVYWSSPINQFNVNSVFSTSNHIYEWNPTISNDNGGQGDWVGAAGQNMSIGKGYILRAPSGYPSLVTPYTATFTGDAVTGKPNNGNISVSISRGNINSSFTGLNGVLIEDFDDNWNLVGNPYPSAISAKDFLTINTNIDGYVCLWRHLTQPNSDIDPFYDDFADGSNYTEADYIYFNLTGVSTPSGFVNFNVDSSDKFIGAGQGFMVNMLDSAPSNPSNVVFNNSMRDIFNDNSQFYRTAGETDEKHKIWLNLYNSNYGILNTTLVGYVAGATMERDRLYDAVTKADNPKIYSIIGEEYFIIQGRALPFNLDDHIPLGIKVKTTGSYYIGIAEVAGLFKTDDQTIYLKDNYLGLTYNLSEDPYSFTSTIGEFNDRFELVFRDEVLSVNENALSSSGLTIIDLPDGSVKFKVAGNYSISQVEIIDLLGRTLYRLEGSQSEEVYFLPQLNQSAYIAKVTLDNGQTLIKKAVKK